MGNRIWSPARGAAIVGLLLLVVGCMNEEAPRSSAEAVRGAVAAETPSPSESPEPPEPLEPFFVAFGSYRRPGFYANSVLTLARETLATTGTLRLGDAVTSPVVDPQKRLLALGGINFGNVILVDPARLDVAGKVDVAAGRYEEVNVVAWPQPERLLGYAQESPTHHLLPGTAFVADPQRYEIVKSVPLHGAVMSASATRRGVAFLVAPVERVGRTRVLLMDVQGEVRSAVLGKIEAGYVDPGTPGESLLREPALVSVRDTVYVIGAFDPIAAIDVKSGVVSYQRVPGLMDEEILGRTDPATGSAGALEVRRRDADVIRGSRVLVTGDETKVVRGGTHLHHFQRVPQLVDLAKRRVLTSFDGLNYAELAGRTVFGDAPGDDLVAMSLSGELLYRRRARTRSWTVIGERLFEYGVNGRRVVELDIDTGRVLSEFGDRGYWIGNARPWPP